MILAIGLLCIVLVLVLLSRRRLGYFQRLGVKHPPTLPFVGNLGTPILRGQHLSVPIQGVYNNYRNERFVGIYEFMNPVFVLRDLDLIKAVAIKDCDNFLNHRVTIDENIEPLFGRNLTALKDDKWRQMRATLSPAFTSAKMRKMFSFIADCGDNVTDALAVEMDSNNTPHLDLEVKDLFTRYANDVIGSCAYGIQVNSMTDRENYFYRLGKAITTFSGLQILKFFGFTSFPKLMKWFKFTIYDEKVTNYFRDLVLSNMKKREEKGILRLDMIHLLMEAKKGNLKHETEYTDTDSGFAAVDESNVGKIEHKTAWEDDDLVAQALIFFLGGFDTVSTVLNFLAYELAINPDVQRRVQAEIDESLRRNNGTVSYNDVQQMKYLDMVVSETLRKWPPAIMADRQCKRPYNLGKPQDTASCVDVYMEAGCGVFIPIHAIHYDEKYWPNPEQFDPERFSAKNKENVVPMSYLPFGIGPRNCIGSRFALMELKVMILKLCSKFDVMPGPKTQIPLVLAANTFNMQVKNGNWLRISKRNFEK